MGTVTQANMRLSVVNGTAFVDFSAANTLTPWLGSKLTITDSAGKTLTGYIKAAGSGETYGSELLANTAFGDTTNTSATDATAASIAGGQAGNCLEVTATSDQGTIYESTAITAGLLIKASAYFKKGTGNGWLRLIRENGGWHLLSQTGTLSDAAWTQYTLYASVPGDTTLLNFYSMTNGLTALYDTASVKQILTPSTTGCTIVSTPGGSTYNWATEESGFNRNDSSGYTYTIESVTVGTVTQSKMRLSIVDGTAFVDFGVGGTLTPFLGSKLEIRDSTGKKVTGYIKAAGTGETLGTETITSQTDRDFSGANNWANVDYNAFDSTGDLTVTANGQGQYCRLPGANASRVTGRLYKLQVDVANIVSTFYIADFGWGQNFVEALSTNGTQTYYLVCTGNRSGFRIGANTATSSSDFDNWTCKQVTAPSETGVTITSTQNGTTYNWASEDSGFNRNDSSGYTFVIIDHETAIGLGNIPNISSANQLKKGDRGRTS